MTLYEFKSDAIAEVKKATFGDLALTERGDLQRLLRDQVEIVCPDAMVLAEEFGHWEESKRRIDLLALDKEARLVVIELKRTEDGGHMELQAVRYAAMLSTMTFAQAVDAHAHYLKSRGKDEDAQSVILQFLGWKEPDDEAFGNEVRIVLASANFSREVTTSVLWLSGFGIDIRCIRLRPYTLEGKALVDVQQIIPLPEAAEYVERVRQKDFAKKVAASGNRDYTRFDVTVAGVVYERMPKTKAIFLVVRGLCATGVTPDEISKAISWRGQIWRIVEGTLGQGDFEAAAAASASQGGAAFDPTRWRCTDDELIHFDGRTYALTNQWGARTEEALEALMDRWPDRGVSYAICDAD